MTATTYRTPVGLLNHLVTITRFDQTSFDDRGTPIGAWLPVATVWAQWMPLAGRWAETARQLAPFATIRALIHFRPDVSRLHRITHHNATYTIAHVIDQPPGGHTLELLLEETP